jgi:hypothetical protein
MPKQQPQQSPVDAPPSTGVVFSDNVPQQVSHSGHYYIQIELEPSDFLAQAVAGGDR